MPQTNAARVLLTNPIHRLAQARLSDLVDLVVAPDTQADTLRKLAADCDALVVRSHLPEDIFQAAPRIRYVVRHGVGLDMVPMAAAQQSQVVVANLPASNTQAVIEYVVAAMFALRRNIVQIDAVMRRDGWDTAKPLSNECIELGGNTLGIVGYGSIGQRLAQIAQVLGMDVVVHTRRPQTVTNPAVVVDLVTLMQSADVIVLACPLTEQTHHLIDASALANTKSSALLINVARGPVVDTPSLVAALMAGRLAGAALDVHENAPLSGREKLFSCPNVLLTPHLAGNTATSLSQMSQWAVDTLLALLAGDRPSNVVSP